MKNTAKPGSIVIRTDPGAKREVTEHHAIVCGHCQHTVEVHEEHGERKEDLACACPYCWHLICFRCAQITHKTLKCRPIEAWAEEQEARYMMLRDMGLA